MHAHTPRRNVCPAHLPCPHLSQMCFAPCTWSAGAEGLCICPVPHCACSSHHPGVPHRCIWHCHLIIYHPVLHLWSILPIHPSIHIHPSFCPIGPSILFHLNFSLSTSQALSLSLSVSSLFQFINLSSISLAPICHLSPSHSHLIPSALSSSCTTPSQPGRFVLPLLRIPSCLAPIDAHLEAGPHVCQPLYICPSMHASTCPNPHSHVIHASFMCPDLHPCAPGLVKASRLS